MIGAVADEKSLFLERRARMIADPNPMSSFEYRPPRWPQLIVLVATVALTAVFIDVIFLPEKELLPFEFEPVEVGLFEQVMFGTFTLIGVFFTGVTLYRLIRRPVTFRLTDDGFEYAPAGVSTGWVRWADVEELKYTTVATGNGDQNRRKVLGVYLKDPRSFIARRPLALHALFEMRQFQSGTPLVFQSGEFGREHDRIVAMMQERLRRAR
ncbi:MAG: hypothetical protein C0518_09300 [Opitutus sp.]|nr:hypothetical protein [Opitutus sp.]